MATQTPKARRVFFHSKEAIAGTADTYEFFEGRSMEITFPEPTYLKESDMGKIGSGEHGTKTELQAIFTPFSIKAQRLSEIAYLMSYFMGTADSVETIDTGVYSHQLKHLYTASRTLPTFTWDFSDTQTASAADQFKHAIINDFSLTLAAGGNGVIDATFNGFANLHYDNSGVLTRNATVDNSSFSANHSFASEPLINFKSCRFWVGTGLTATPLVQTDVSFTAEDLAGSPTDICPLVNSITITGNNGLNGEDLMRACGDGVLNNQERGDRAFTLEVNARRDTSTIAWDTLALGDTSRALEIQFEGPVLSGTDIYAMNLFLPNVVPQSAAQDDESPINQTVPFDVFEDTNYDAFYAYFQNGVADGLNATNT